MKSKTAATILNLFIILVSSALLIGFIRMIFTISGQVILKEADINMDTVNKYFTATETNTLHVTTNKNRTNLDTLETDHEHNIITNAYQFNWLPRNEDSIALVLDTHHLEKWHKLISVRTNGVPVVEITSTGEVLYDTNNVSVATHIFWRELSFEIKRNLKR